MSDLATLDLRVLGILDDALKQIISQASHLARTARPLCDGRFVAAWRVEATPLAVSFFGGLYNLRSLARCPALQDAAPRYRHVSLFECGRTLDTLSYFFFSALWLGEGQSIWTQVQQTNVFDLMCFTTMPTKHVVCLQVGTMALEWPVALPAGSDQSSLHLRMKNFRMHIQETLSQLHAHFRWRRDAQPPELRRGCLDRNTGVHYPRGGFRCGM